ncbi:hypothetical protein DFP72DRAFT_201838 [Ephemerocybe angulata]|uniref:Uncharacterized protein n=1 Tax=Ephemerocybe angulata TaxID=980116 RepID=A0A8H6IH24_9AGAR|nr:hypothetical protein DFP72DRAFT_201838 [Tulosesus angulatus]
MPEIVEGFAHFLTAKWALDLFGDSSRCVQAIWADFTAKESAAAEIPHGMVQKLTPGTRIRRGTHRRQTPVLAAELQDVPDNLSRIEITDLEIKDVHHSVRALIVDLGPLWLRLAYLTHTAVQVYRKDRWEELLVVPSTLRKFSIGLAFECEDFVLAFASMDKLFQPIWATTRAGLSVKTGEIEPPCVLNEYLRFLEGVADWIHTRWRLERQDFAVNAIREANDVFIGIGAYTINEVFFLAGIPIGIRECDLFGCPSRCSRFLEAYWAFAYRAENALPSFLRPALDAGMLAPDSNGRQSYPERFLRIYGKPDLSLPRSIVELANEHNQTVESIHKQVIDGYWYRSEWIEFLPDPFEPAYLLDALHSPLKGNIYLSHLIWGDEEWERIRVHHNLPEPARTDPITEMYSKLGEF